MGPGADGNRTAIRATLDSGTILPWPPFNINYDFRIMVEDGRIRGFRGEHDGFPSYEVWVYEYGKAPRLLYHHRETNVMDLRGCCDIKVNIQVND